MSTKRITIITICILTAIQVAAQTACPFRGVKTQRLPDMSIPRFSHSAFYVNGDVVVVGGHTSGFVPTNVAEYYKDGEWHQLQSVYTHDNGFALVMKSGKVLIAGGNEQPLGIGQTFPVEIYDPETHTFTGFGCLYKKRCRASMVELDGGKVYISGNWYGDDGIEVFDGKKAFSFVKGVSAARSYPYALRISKDDVIFFGNTDAENKIYDTIMIDRLRGEPFTVPLFEEWKPEASQHECDRMNDNFIGNEAKGIYTYLIPVKNKEGEIGIAKVNGADIELLPTLHSIPRGGKYGEIEWMSYLVADRKAQRAYIAGVDKDYHLYIAAIDYSRSPAPLTVYVTDSDFLSARSKPVLLPDGNLMFTGGIYNDHFQPTAAAYIVYVGSQPSDEMAINIWPWGGMAVLLLAIIAVASLIIRRRRAKTMVPRVHPADVTEPSEQSEDKEQIQMQRICNLMESGQLYLNTDLKLTDIATRLNTNSRYISDCINSQRGCSFSQFVNSYRIDYAKQLLRTNPDEKISTLYMKVGFANERSFFRAFKQFTGKTPSEWVADIL